MAFPEPFAVAVLLDGSTHTVPTSLPLVPALIVTALPWLVASVST